MCSLILIHVLGLQDRQDNFHFVDEETEAQSNKEAACGSRYQSQESNLALSDFKAGFFSTSWNLWSGCQRL